MDRFVSQTRPLNVRLSNTASHQSQQSTSMEPSRRRRLVPLRRMHRYLNSVPVRNPTYLLGLQHCSYRVEQSPDPVGKTGGPGWITSPRLDFQSRSPRHAGNRVAGAAGPSSDRPAQPCEAHRRTISGGAMALAVHGGYHLLWDLARQATAPQKFVINGTREQSCHGLNTAQ